jgi:hypothetical protein
MDMDFEEFKEQLPELLGDDYYNDKEKRQPTKYFENVDSFATLAKRALNADRKISAHGTELKRATEGMIKIPGEGATEEDIKAYRKAIGIPEKQEDYQLKIPDQDKEGFEAIAKQVRTAAHQVGIAPSKLSAVWDQVMTALVAQNQALEQKGMELLAADVQALKEAKKEKYDAFIAETDRVAAELDVKGDLNAGRPDNPIGSNFMRLMDNMGIKDTPVVREFLGAIAPLVLEGKTIIGGSTPTSAGEGGFDYQYDEHGKPI